MATNNKCQTRFSRSDAKHRWYALIGVTGLVLAAPAMARGEPVRFDIARQPLSSALKEFAEQAQMQLLYEHGAVARSSGNAVTGELDKQAALAQLLRDTGFEVVYSSETAATIRPAPAMQTKNDANKSERVRAADADQPKHGSAHEPGANSLEVIIVSARRREEKIQSVPISITAVSQQALQENNVTTVTDLQHLVPSMTGNIGISRDAFTVSIRGQRDSNSRPGVIMYLNDVPVPQDIDGGAGLAGGPGLFFDLENVQVLKGPQGTLFGRESVGGAVLLQTARPENEFGGRVQLGFGNYESREIDAAVNVPIVDDKLLTRIAFNGQKRDGFAWIDRSANHPNGTDMDNRDFWSVRGTITFRPVDWLQNDTIATYQHYENNGSAPFLSLVNADAANAFGRLFPSVGLSTLPALLAQQEASGIRSHIPVDGSIESRGTLFAISNTTSIDLTDDLKLRTILGFDRAVTGRAFDLDGTPLPIANQPRVLRTSPLRQYTAEAQLLGNSFGRRLEWITGAFFLENPYEDDVIQTGTQFGFVNDAKGRSTARSKAVFGQGTYDLSALMTGLKVTGGLRYTWDTSDSVGIYNGLGTNCSSTPTVRCDDSSARRSHSESSALTWTTGLDYQVTPDTLLYLASRRGYRAGGVNAQVGGVAVEYDPEYVLDYELGIKSDWSVAGRALRTNAAIFYQDYTDIQISRSVFVGNAINVITDNAAEANLWGAELEALVRLTSDLEFGASASYLEINFTEFAQGVSAGTIADLETKEKANPAWKYGLSARYRLPLDAQLADVSINANWNWQAEFTIGTNSLGTQNVPAYGLLNLAVNWDHVARSPVDVSFFMSNVTNKEYAVGGLGVNKLIGYNNTFYGEPRMYGMRVRWRFGAE